MSVVVTVLAAACVGLALWASVRLIRDQPVIFRQVITAGVLEAGVVLQVLAAVVMMVAGRAVNDPATFIGYLVTAVILLPAASLWAFAERTRWSSAVMVVAAVALAIVEVRMNTLWSAAAQVAS